MLDFGVRLPAELVAAEEDGTPDWYACGGVGARVHASEGALSIAFRTAYQPPIDWVTYLVADPSFDELTFALLFGGEYGDFAGYRAWHRDRSDDSDDVDYGLDGGDDPRTIYDLVATRGWDFGWKHPNADAVPNAVGLPASAAACSRIRGTVLSHCNRAP